MARRRRSPTRSPRRASSRAAIAFRVAAVLTLRAGPLLAAEFAFPAHASLRATLGVLRTGRPVQHRLTIPEGLTAAQIARLIEAAPALDGATPLPAEGAVLPQTYSYERGTSRAVMVARARVAMERALDRAWAERDPDLPLNDPTQLLTLASIVERETARPDERARVAAVFLNRLRLGMRLQSDPTVAYAASGGTVTADRRADARRPGPPEPLQHVSRGRPAAGTDRQPRRGSAAGGGAAGEDRRALFRRGRHRRPRLRAHAGGARAQRGAVAGGRAWGWAVNPPPCRTLSPSDDVAAGQATPRARRWPASASLGRWRGGRSAPRHPGAA